MEENEGGKKRDGGIMWLFMVLIGAALFASLGVGGFVWLLQNGGR